MRATSTVSDGLPGMGFTFVDHISAIDSDRACGLLRRGPGAPPLPPWLMIEAVGQLAAWIAMRRTDFSRRPVAALVGDVRLSGATVGGTLELEAQIGRFDGRAILYSGVVRVSGTEVAVLVRSVGPMLPMDAFDDPAAMRERFAMLCAAGARAGAGGAEGEIPRPALAAVEVDGGAARAHLRVPESAPFFADHFPRRPVYPAALLADAMHQLAAPLAARELGVAAGSVFASRLVDLKVRSFSPPGQLLDLAAEARPPRDGVAGIAVCARAAGKRVASSVLEYRSMPARSA